MGLAGGALAFEVEKLVALAFEGQVGLSSYFVFVLVCCLSFYCRSGTIYSQAMLQRRPIDSDG